MSREDHNRKIRTKKQRADVGKRSFVNGTINPLSAELNPTCHLLALLGAHHILHVSRIRVNNRQ